MEDNQNEMPIGLHRILMRVAGVAERARYQAKMVNRGSVWKGLQRQVAAQSLYTTVEATT